MPVQDLYTRFAFHTAEGDLTRQNAHSHIRAHCAELAHELNVTVPDGREKSLAITKLEEAMFWANAAIAREGKS